MMLFPVPDANPPHKKKGNGTVEAPPVVSAPSSAAPSPPSATQDAATRRHNQRVRRQMFIDNVVAEVLDFRWLSRRKERAKKNKYHNFIVNGVWPTTSATAAGSRDNNNDNNKNDNEDDNVTVMTNTTTTTSNNNPDDYFWVMVPPKAHEIDKDGEKQQQGPNKYLEITHPCTHKRMVVQIPPDIQSGETFPVPF